MTTDPSRYFWEPAAEREAEAVATMTTADLRAHVRHLANAMRIEQAHVAARMLDRGAGLCHERYEGLPLHWHLTSVHRGRRAGRMDEIELGWRVAAALDA